MWKNGGIIYCDFVVKVFYYVNLNMKLWVGYDDKESIYVKVWKISQFCRYVLLLQVFISIMYYYLYVVFDLMIICLVDGVDY